MKFELYFKKIHPKAQLPTQSKSGDAGWDLRAVEDAVIPPGQFLMIPTGLVFAEWAYEAPRLLTENTSYYLHISARSGLASKGVFPIGGVVDMQYRGEIKVILFNSDKHQEFQFKAGDRVAQLVIQQIITTDSHNQIQMIETDSIEETDRGSGGLGSTGA